jgi:hypothetical protein
MIAIKSGELLRSYQEYPAKSVGKQAEEFLIAALVKSYQDSYKEFSKIGESTYRDSHKLNNVSKKLLLLQELKQQQQQKPK